MQIKRPWILGAATLTATAFVIIAHPSQESSAPASLQANAQLRSPGGLTIIQGGQGETADGVTSLALPLWIGAASLAGALFVALTWLYFHQRQRHWQQVNFIRREAKAFRERQAVKNIIDILDYEEYRTFTITHPETGRTLSFEAHDARLRRALRSHDQMSKTRAGLNEIKRLAKNHSISPDTRVVFEQYEQEEFFIEVTLRDWFDSFLGGLEYFETMIASGLISALDIKPFIIYWIQLIGDRSYRRKGGSGFYDQLSHYIYWAGYTGVQNLFERYGFKVLPPPYSSSDFEHIAEDQQYDTVRALSLAKAAHLVYEDRTYVSDIVKLWLSDHKDNQWMRMSSREYVVEVIKAWQQEGKEDQDFGLSQNFKYLDMLTTDTQAFFFRQGTNIVLVFRGSQQLNDWKTNFKIRMRPFSSLADPDAVLPRGHVHRGFLDAWHSVEKMVVYYLRKWWTPETRLWITGHSLGGALANMAAISLEHQGFKVSGLYTFGQPRIASWQLVKVVNKRMKDRIFRYANNNDVVPLIPPQIYPWMPTQGYIHMGQFRYFSWNGRLQERSFVGQRWLDRLIGYVLALQKSGIDAVDDHKMEFYVANLQAALERETELAQLAQEKERLRENYSEK